MKKNIISEKERKAINESIAHWKRMVKWAKNKNNRRGKKMDHGRYGVMLEALGECPSNRHCALCFQCNETCSLCLLQKKYGTCYSSTNAYYQVTRATSWPKFVEAGNLMIKQLESL